MSDAGERVHLVGAGGSGMAALGCVLLDRGAAVTGSDLKDSPGAALLCARGATIRIGPHHAAALDERVDAVVASAAVPDDNPEVAAARARGLPVARYADALGRAMAIRPETRGIAIAGTHGKTTTTAMVAFALRELGHDPSWVVGGDVPQLSAPGHGGRGPHFVAEACEYAASFLSLSFSIAAVTNVEADHLDYYGTEEALLAAFGRFVGKLPPDGTLVVTPAAARALAPVLPAGRAPLTAGLDADAAVRAVDLRTDGGFPAFRIVGAFESASIEMAIPGRHFAEDFVLACAVVHAAAGEGAAAADALQRFTGVARRLETIVDGDGIALLSDYAHHPTELDAVREALRARFPGRRLFAVFQPHQAGRTRHFLAAFARALAGFDAVLVPDIYVTRDSDEDRRAVSSQDLVDAVSRIGGNARYAGPLDATVPAILRQAERGDVVVLLGAGSIDALRHPLQVSLPVAL